MNKDEISTMPWPWHGFPFAFHHHPADTPRAFFLLNYSMPLSQSQLDTPLLRKSSVSSSAIVKPDQEVPSQGDPEPLPQEPVTPPKRGLKIPTFAFVSSTPSQSGALVSAKRGSGGAKLKASRHNSWVKRYFPNKVIWGVDPTEFIDGVWSDTVPIRDQHFPNADGTQPESYQLYAEYAEKLVKAKDERQSYAPLVEMLNDVVRQLCGVKTDPGYVKRPYTGVFYLHDIIHFHGVTNERMDLVYSTVERRKGVTADFESAFVEVKKEDRDSKAQEEKAQEGNAHRAKAKAWEGTQPSQSGTGPTDWTTRFQLDVRRAVSAPAGSRPGKRKRGSGEDDYDAPDAKRRTGSQMQPLSSDARVRSLTDNEAQAVRPLIETDDMRLWYGDRMGLIVSKKYKWLKEDNWIFLRCIAAIAQASVHEMGIFPFLQFPIKDGETMFTSYEGAYLSITACPYDGEAAEEAKDAEKLEFALAVKDPHVYAEFGVVGRGTSVLAVVAKPDTKARELYKDEELVAKISWPHEARQAEDVLIKAVRRALKKEKPQYLPNIVDLKCSVTRSIEEIGLPRVAMGILPEARDLRICRTLVMKRYQRLEMLETVDDFKKIYIQIVRAHYWVYETSYILHRDLSINNIMWYRIGDRLVAVLCDWDLAEHQINGPTSSRPVRDTQATPPVGIPKAASQTDAGAQPVDPALKPRYRTGTGPFMAMDLLRKGAPPPHLYRYDLESLFYILICVCAALDLKTKTFRRLVLWEQESLLEIGRIKREFLTGGIKEYETFFKGCSTAFKSLFTGKKSWARQLWYQFSAVERAYDKIVEAEDAESRSDTDSQEDDELQEAEAEEEEEEEVGPPVKPKVTVPLSQPSVEELKAQRETLIGYAQFMAILGAPKSIRAPA